MQRANGTLIGDTATMNQMLREHWKDTFQLYDTMAPPTWEAFKARYERLFPRVARMTKHRPHT